MSSALDSTAPLAAGTAFVELSHLSTWGSNPVASAGTDSLSAPQPCRYPDRAREMKKRQPRKTHAGSHAVAKPQVFEQLGQRSRGSQGKLLLKLQSSNNSGKEKGRTLFSVSCQ